MENYENINEIDLSINPAFLDDDDSFGSIKDTLEESIGADDRNFQAKTGIIIDLSDDDDTRPIRKIEAKLNDFGGIDIEKDFDSELLDNADYNSIDMETDYFDDDDEDLIAEVTQKQEIAPTFENDLDEAKKRKKPTGEVTKDYWKDLAKKHLKTNKKGAYNTHFHLAGNPKADMEFFNRAMGLGDTEMDDAAIDGIVSNIAAGNITGVASGESSGDFGGDGGGMGESLNSNNDTDSAKLLRDIFDIIGVDVVRNSDDSFTVIDLFDDVTEYECENLDALKLTLHPYIEDCFVYPLQIATKQKLKSCSDWVEWYKDINNQKAYPKCADDIKYCDVIANKLNADLVEAAI